MLNRRTVTGDTIDEARGRGCTIVRDLQLACLLQGLDGEEDKVKIDGVIRDMALWIQKERFEVYTGRSKFFEEELSKKESHKTGRLEGTKRLSLMINEPSDHYMRTLDCP